VAKGVWDDAEALEGTLDAMRRIRGPKELFLARGGHLSNVRRYMRRTDNGKLSVLWAVLLGILRWLNRPHDKTFC